MMRKALIFIALPSSAFAHDGLHFHPHGMQFGWLALVAIGVFAGVALAARWRK